MIACTPAVPATAAAPFSSARFEVSTTGVSCVSPMAGATVSRSFSIAQVSEKSGTRGAHGTVEEPELHCVESIYRAGFGLDNE